MKNVGVNFPVDFLRAIDNLVQEGVFTSRSECIRHAVKDFLININHKTLLRKLIEGETLPPGQMSIFLEYADQDDRKILEQHLSPNHHILKLLNAKFSIHLKSEQLFYL